MKFEQPISIVVKAYNEAENIGNVLKVLVKISWIDEIIVVNDGSKDKTAEVVEKFKAPNLKLINHEKNMGMGAGMATGIKNAKSDLVMFLDADLVGLTEQHLLTILAPVIFTKEADLGLGVFGLQEISKDTSTKIANHLLPLISGQRAIWKRSLPSLDKIAESRYGADLLIAKNVPRSRRAVVVLDGLSQVTKEQKAGGDFVKAFSARMKMYKEVSKVLAKDKE